MKKLFFCFMLAALAASAQAIAPAASKASTKALIDTRLNFIIHSLDLSTIDTIVYPGTLLLIK